MSLLSECKSKFGIADDSGRLGIVRAFAFGEFVCQPVSIASVAVAVVFAILCRTGVWTLPEVITDWLVPVFVSVVVGYLTNWIAITMLFEPYDRTWRHWLPWVTLGMILSDISDSFVYHRAISQTPGCKSLVGLRRRFCDLCRFRNFFPRKSVCLCVCLWYAIVVPVMGEDLARCRDEQISRAWDLQGALTSMCRRLMLTER